MTRLTPLPLAVVLLLALVLPAGAGSGAGEELTVGEGQTEETETKLRATATGARQPYRFVTSGVIEETDGSGKVIRRYDPFYCFEGCGSPPSFQGFTPLSVSTPNTAANFVPPSNFSKRHLRAIPSYESDHVYSFPLDYVRPEDEGRWDFRAVGGSPMFAGGFVVEIGQPAPIVSWKFKQQGEPARGAPKSLIATTFQTKGKGRVDLDADRHAPNLAARGSGAIHVVTEGPDSLTTFKTRDRLGGFSDEDGEKTISVPLVVTRSDRRGCKKGDKAGLRLIDGEDKSDDRVTLEYCGHDFVYRRSRGSAFSLQITVLD